MKMQSNHPIEREELMAYLDGELPLDKASLIAGHLETCRQCQAFSSDLKRLSEQMLTWQVDPVPLSPPAAPARKLPVAEQRRPWYLWKPLWAGAAAVMVLGVIGMELELRTSNLPVAALSDAQPRPRVMAAPEPETPLALRRSGLQQAGSSQALMMDEPRSAAAPNAQGGRRTATVGESVVVAPLIARTASLSLLAPDVSRLQNSLEQVLQRHHAYLADMTLSAEESSARTLNASLRTPGADLEGTIADLKALGKVLRESRVGEDVSQQSVDLDARLANARRREQVLNDLLQHRTGRLSDVLEVEQQVSETRGEIERMEAQRKSLDKRIEYARIDLQVSEVYRARLATEPTGAGTRLSNAAVEGMVAVKDSFIACAIFLLANGPVILIWILLLGGGPAWYLWRRRQRRA
jgi:hypothetical protein